MTMGGPVIGLGDLGARLLLMVGGGPLGTERDVSREYIPIDEAARRSGLHSNTIARLMRRGVLRGFKATCEGHSRWMVSVQSLQHYTDPVNGFLLDMPGPKLFLNKLYEEQTGAGQD